MISLLQTDKVKKFNSLYKQILWPLMATIDQFVIVHARAADVDSMFNPPVLR